MVQHISQSEDAGIQHLESGLLEIDTPLVYGNKRDEQIYIRLILSH